MRFFCIFKPNPALLEVPPDPLRMEKIGKFVEESFRSGVLLATEGFRPNVEDVRVSLRDGKMSVVDGPFTEAKELIGGFALLDCKSRAEAIEHAKRFLEVVGGGESEIHQLLDTPQMPLEKVK
jgi:hypothetical protein